MSKGHMVWKDKRIPVREVVERPRTDEHGVRDGWNATAGEGPIESRMFYPADMFTFEPEEGADRG
ncbi:MAG TPA: hypothetical protein VN041_14105 [Microbacterium sp.]|nr:hypothetical protein [Microbacterium sp.]